MLTSVGPAAVAVAGAGGSISIGLAAAAVAGAAGAESGSGSAPTKKSAALSARSSFRNSSNEVECFNISSSSSSNEVGLIAKQKQWVERATASSENKSRSSGLKGRLIDIRNQGFDFLSTRLLLLQL